MPDKPRDPEMIAAARAYVARGGSCYAFARRHRLHRKTVQRWCADLVRGRPKGPPVTVATPEIVAAVLARRDDGAPLSALSREFNAAYGTVQAIVRRHRGAGRVVRRVTAVQRRRARWLAAEGASTRAIASLLGLSQRCIHGYVADVLAARPGGARGATRLERARGRAALAAVAAEIAAARLQGKVAPVRLGADAAPVRWRWAGPALPTEDEARGLEELRRAHDAYRAAQAAVMRMNENTGRNIRASGPPRRQERRRGAAGAAVAGRGGGSV